jgi:hypothetical protein
MRAAEFLSKGYEGRKDPVVEDVVIDRRQTFRRAVMII